MHCLIRAIASSLSILWLLGYWLNSFGVSKLKKEAAEACPSLHMSKCHIVGNLMLWLLWFVPCHEKTCLRGFWPGPAQTSLSSYRDLLERWNFVQSKFWYPTLKKANNKGADQTTLMGRLSVLCLCCSHAKSQVFSGRRPFILSGTTMYLSHLSGALARGLIMLKPAKISGELLRDIWPSYFIFQIVNDKGCWSDCADAQAGLWLCFSHATKSGFLTLRPYDVVAQASWPTPGYAPACHWLFIGCYVYMLLYTQKKKFSQYLCFLIKSTILHISLSNFKQELYYRNFTCTCSLRDK